jgi:hypothetical protein
MLGCFLLMTLYFRNHGAYAPVELPIVPAPEPRGGPVGTPSFG